LYLKRKKYFVLVENFVDILQGAVHDSLTGINSQISCYRVWTVD